MNESTRQYARKNETNREKSISRKQWDEGSQTLQSPVEQVLHLQKTIGNQAVTELIQSGAIQAKLKIGQPDDIYEQEADRVAEQVMRMEEPKQSLVNGHSSLVQRETNCPECMEEAEQAAPLVQRETMDVEENEDELKPKLMGDHFLQRQEAIPDDEDDETALLTKATPGITPGVTSDIESRINSMKGGGQPLSEVSRAFFEPRFGADFSGVRIHTDPCAAQTAQAINAKAFTTGKDIVFGSGQYSPDTPTGKRLLSHELTHVVQQSAEATKGTRSLLEKRGIPIIIQRSPSKTKLFWSEPIKKNANILEARAAENLGYWLSASYQAINDLISDVLKASLDKKQWSGFTTALLGNIIWAFSAFLPGKIAPFAISILGIAVGSLGSIPSPTKVNRDRIKNVMKTYVENFHRALRNRLPGEVVKYVEKNPQKTGRQAISDFLRSNFKKGLYSLSGTIPLINTTAVRNHMYRRAFSLLEQTKKFSVSGSLFTSGRDSPFLPQRGINKMVAYDANEEIRKKMPNILTYQMKNPTKGVLIVIHYAVYRGIYQEGHRKKKFGYIGSIIGYKTKQAAIQKHYRTSNILPYYEGYTWDSRFHWIPPLK